MKNINNKKKNTNPMKEAKRGPYFEQFSKEAKDRIALGVEIYNTRISLGISQQELARITKTTQKMISNIESANIDIRFSTLNKIKKALNFKSDNWARIYSFVVENKKALSR
ncbi:MAG: helix-turn-helix domain-containing protein [Patescibacteria group bacterium]|jgi:ribosome-binding protein aMBF1 (putative translation factor)